MMELWVPAALAAACVAVSTGAFFLFRAERATYRDAELSDRDLYASGEDAAREREHERFPQLAGYLHRAGVESSPLSWAANAAALAVVTFAVAAVFSGSLAWGLAAGSAAVGGALVRVEVLRRRRRTLLDRQFARVLPQLAASVRSSLTFERAVRIAASHVEEPLREEFTRVLADTAYGASLAEAFEGMAQRTGSPDVRALAAAIRIQRRFGGAVATVLDTIADHANARLKASRELKTELAGTRLAKWFVAASMPAIFLIMFATNADFARFYREEPLGWALLGIALAFEVLGLTACQRITAMKGDGRS